MSIWPDHIRFFDPDIENDKQVRKKPGLDEGFGAM